MGKDSSIEWTHHTHNLWWGCVKVGQGCKNCYAEDWMDAKQYWGARAPRRFFRDAHYRQPLAWDRAAARAGERHRVFCGSMMDLFEEHQDSHVNHRMEGLRLQLFNRIVFDTSNLDWLFLTKRLENVLEMVPGGWIGAWPRNAWLGFSASTQEEYMNSLVQMGNILDVLRQGSLPPVTFASLEPLVEAVNLVPFRVCPGCGVKMTDNDLFYTEGDCINVGAGTCPWRDALEPWLPLNWIITGGEGGKHARPMHPDWARRVRDDCAAAGVPFFFKQWGAWLPAENYVEGWHNGVLPEGAVWMADGQGSATHVKVNKKLAGAILDGCEWRQVPEVQHASS